MLYLYRTGNDYTILNYDAMAAAGIQPAGKKRQPEGGDLAEASALRNVGTP